MTQMMKPFWLLALVVLLGCCSTAHGQETVTLTWKDVIDRSLSNNLDIRMKDLDLRTQTLTRRQAIGAFLPTLSYEGAATKNYELPVSQIMGQTLAMGTTYDYWHGLTLSWPIFTGFSRIANLKGQSSLKKSLEAELEGVQDETVLRAVSTYFSVMLADALIRVNREAVEAATANLEQVRRFYAAGAASNLDLKRAEAEYYSALPALESARNQRAAAEDELKYTLNIPLADSLAIPDTLALMRFMGRYSDLSVAELKQVALGNNPDLRVTAHQVNLAKQQKTAALGRFMPTLSLTASVGYEAMLDEYEVSQEDYCRSKSVYLVAGWPLFEGGDRVFETQKADVKVKQAELTAKQAHDRILLDVERSYNDLAEATKNLASLDAAVEQAKESLRLANLQYKEGIITQVEVLDAQTLYMRSSAGYQEGVYAYNVSQLDLLAGMGKIRTIWDE